MIRNLVDFALNNRYVVLAVGALLLLWGAVSFHNMPVEVYPDIADNYVNVISQWPGHSAEEMEQQVSVPVEIQVFGIPHLTTVRSESSFGLSLITLIFDGGRAASNRNGLESDRPDLLVHDPEHQSGV